MRDFQTALDWQVRSYVWMAALMRHFDRAGHDGLPQRILGDVALGVLFSKTGELSRLLGPKEPEDR